MSANTQILIPSRPNVAILRHFCKNLLKPVSEKNQNFFTLLSVLGFYRIKFASKWEALASNVKAFFSRSVLWTRSKGTFARFIFHTGHDLLNFREKKAALGMWSRSMYRCKLKNILLQAAQAQIHNIIYVQHKA